ncbi:hypothetical protein K503DRAFT_745650 [Rhizopogon vinicolor AM-OR11-026]|uniref:Methyltransferase n=1 Tax=Rhizopogon vinicolor AM-OR11-026 TaxID=1314800 RepID=A0A1B7MSR1_9AGAM|nr:hypothetical protein K503DRAFT_745650 [Rhizopogon vinicolor AM-OR11-026]
MFVVPPGHPTPSASHDHWPLQRSIMTSNESLSPDDVQATLRYTLPDPTGESLYSYLICPPPPVLRTNAQPDLCSVVISNVRGREDEFSLDTCGFEFLKHPSTVKEFFDEEVIRTHYYPEVKEFLKTHTGAKRVIIVSHTVRHGHGRDVKSDQVHVQGPAHLVHVDRTFEASMAQVRETCGDRAKCLEGRIRLINVWRPIGSTVYHEPLALADWRSVCVDDDLLPLRVIYACQEIQTVTCRYSNSHRWYYLKEQTPSEITLIKCFDSRTDGCARLTLHSAFHDDTGCPPDAPQRQSIEVHAIVLDED